GRYLVAEGFAAARRHDDQGMATAADLLDDLRLKPAEGGIAEGMPQDRKGRACFFWNHRLRHRVWESRRPATWPAALVGGGDAKGLCRPWSFRRQESLSASEARPETVV